MINSAGDDRIKAKDKYHSSIMGEELQDNTTFKIVVLNKCIMMSIFTNIINMVENEIQLYLRNVRAGVFTVLCFNQHAIILLKHRRSNNCSDSCKKIISLNQISELL
jgi:hypothetical protein